MAQTRRGGPEPLWQRIVADGELGDDAGAARGLLRVARNVAAANRYEPGSVDIGAEGDAAVDLDAVAAFLDADVGAIVQRVSGEGWPESQGQGRPAVRVEVLRVGDGGLEVAVVAPPGRSEVPDAAPAHWRPFPEGLAIRVEGLEALFSDAPTEVGGRGGYARRCRDNLVSDASALVVAGWRRVVGILGQHFEVTVGLRPAAVPRDAAAHLGDDEPVTRLVVVDAATHAVELVERARAAEAARRDAAWNASNLREMAREIEGLGTGPEAAEPLRAIFARAGVDTGEHPQAALVAAEVLVRTLDRVDRRWRDPFGHRARSRRPAEVGDDVSHVPETGGGTPDDGIDLGRGTATGEVSLVEAHDAPGEPASHDVAAPAIDRDVPDAPSGDHPAFDTTDLAPTAEGGDAFEVADAHPTEDAPSVVADAGSDVGPVPDEGGAGLTEVAPPVPAEEGRAPSTASVTQSRHGRHGRFPPHRSPRGEPRHEAEVPTAVTAGDGDFDISFYEGLRRHPALAEDLLVAGVASVDDLVIQANDLRRRLGEPPIPHGDFPSKRSSFERLVSTFQDLQARQSAS